MSGAVDPIVIVDGIREWARVALASIDGLTPDQRQRLKDLQRKDTRYGFGAIAGVCTIARKSNDPAVYLGPAEVLRCVLLEGRPVPSLDECYDAETLAQAQLDVNQRRYQRARDLAAAAELEANALRQVEWTRLIIERVRTEVLT